MKEVIKTASLERNNSLLQIFKGSLFAFIITIISLIIFALVLAYTNTSETVITPIVICIAGFSILLGGILSSLKIKKRGLVNGSIVGLAYVVIIYILSSIIDKDFYLSASSIIMCVVCIVTGAIRWNNRS